MDGWKKWFPFGMAYFQVLCLLQWGFIFYFFPSSSANLKTSDHRFLKHYASFEVWNTLPVARFVGSRLGEWRGCLLSIHFFGIVRFRSSGVIKFYSWLGGDQRMLMHGNVEGFALNDAFIQVGNRMIPPVSPYSFCPCQFQVFFPTFHATSIHPNEGQCNLQLWKMILRCQIDMTRRSPRTCKAVTWVLWCIKNQGDRKHIPMQNHKKHIIPTNKKICQNGPPPSICCCFLLGVFVVRKFDQRKSFFLSKSSFSLHRLWWSVPTNLTGNHLDLSRDVGYDWQSLDIQTICEAGTLDPQNTPKTPLGNDYS